MKNKKEIISIILLVILCCIMISFVEIIVEPVYFIKSLIKIIMFLLLPILYFKLLNIKILDKFSSLNKKNIVRLLLLGIFIYGVIIGAYFLTRNIFDYSSLVSSLSIDQKVSNHSFIPIALYISFCNSFLEEFLFRYISFIQLSKFITKKVAYFFSSVIFAIYHISMVGSSFSVPLLMISLIGLAIGGFIFDYVDDKNKNIYNSWLIHMFADFALMTIWYIYI